MSKVVIAKGARGHEPVFRALDLIEYRNALEECDTILIKVLFMGLRTWDTGASTDPMVVEAIIKRIKNLKTRIFVVEADATTTDAEKAFEATGMKEMCRQNGIDCINLRAHYQNVW